MAIIGGKTIGRDHFPFPVIDISAYGPFGNHTIFPIDLDVATALYWWAVVNTWHYDVQVTYQTTIEDPDNPGTYIWTDNKTAEASFTFQVPLDDSTNVGPPTREAETVLFAPVDNPNDSPTIDWATSFTLDDIQAENPNWGILDYSYSGPDDDVAFGFTLIFPLTPYWHADTGKLVFHIELSIEDDTGQAASTSVGVTDYPNLLNDNGNLINSAGTGFSEVSYGIRATDPGTPAVDSLKFIDVQSTIQAQEFWPYATKPPASLPVYDTGDGSVLNDPFS